MSDHSKIQPGHLERAAYVYVRQSTPHQLEYNRESTERQYALVERARTLGWRTEQTQVIDEDLGLSGAGTAVRAGFARLTAEVALGRVGIVLGLEASRLARNSADWYRLLDLCAMTDTLIGDSDGLYHPAQFNDRLLLGLKGTMSEAELHIIRARLDGGIRNKAARGELRRTLPVGLVWGEADGEVRLHPDAAVCAAVRAVFARFAEFGSARRVWLWFRAEGLSFPLQANTLAAIRWVEPTYTAIHNILTHPAYAGAYAYGRSRHERYVDATGQIRKRVRRLPRAQWAVLIHDHHPGFIDWATYEANQQRLVTNIHPAPHASGGAVRKGAALLQGLAVCGHCGRPLHTHYRGRHGAPGYHCAGKTVVNGRGLYCLSVGGVQIDAAVTGAFREALAPAALQATVRAAEQLESDRDAALRQWQLALERARYAAQCAERRYRAVDPENRLVARGLEAEWERSLGARAAAESELARRSAQQPRTLSPQKRQRLAALGTDLAQVWNAPTTTDQDRKALLRSLLEEVVIAVNRAHASAHLTLRWRGGLITLLAVQLPRSHPPALRTDEDTIALVRCLAVHYCDAVIAGVLNRQGRRTVRGERFTAGHVGNLRRYWKIPHFQPPTVAPEGPALTIQQAAQTLEVAPSTLHRWLNDGFIAGEQDTPGAPWRIRLTDELKARFVADVPPGYLPMLETTKCLGVSRQTVLQRVKRGELDAVHVRRGRRQGLYIKAIDTGPDLFDPAP
ncbi:recombinase family protein [uncultured Thiodictyon sp.]|uniref:recombinase family protein n=1 Tax=uncultured Thiodictyon sp. TaxID=1846217 RepID=UPI0025D9C8BD|nr:recombinase family protein [uncultured Thiodictyon sp.]